uniref:Uncharacterized protein n=1 Tax=Alexandrium monilatum TaxID=311494 RepID=A0A7S4QTR1_9DINO
MTVTMSPLVLSLNVRQPFMVSSPMSTTTGALCPSGPTRRIVWPRLDAAADAPLLDAPQMPGSLPPSPRRGGGGAARPLRMPVEVPVETLEVRSPPAPADTSEEPVVLEASAERWPRELAEVSEDPAVPEDDEAIIAPRLSQPTSPAFAGREAARATSSVAAPRPARAAAQVASEAAVSGPGSSAETRITRWAVGDLCQQLLLTTSSAAVERLMRACEAAARRRMDELQACCRAQLVGSAGCLDALDGAFPSGQGAATAGRRRSSVGEPDEEPDACPDELPAGSPGIGRVPSTARHCFDSQCQASPMEAAATSLLVELERCRMQMEDHRSADLSAGVGGAARPPSPRELPLPGSLRLGRRSPSQPAVQRKTARCRRVKPRPKSTSSSLRLHCGVQPEACRGPYMIELTPTAPFCTSGQLPLAVAARRNSETAQRADELRQSLARVQEARELLAEMLTPCASSSGGSRSSGSRRDTLEPRTLLSEVPTPCGSVSGSSGRARGRFEPKLAEASQRASVLQPLNGSMPWFPAVELLSPPTKARVRRRGTEEGDGDGPLGEEKPAAIQHRDAGEADEATADEEFCRLLAEALGGSDSEGSS